MRQPLRIALTLLAIFFVSAPLSILATILLSRFWSWFESTTGIESFGHSGPAEWCYVATFLIFFLGAILALRGRRRE